MFIINATFEDTRIHAQSDHGHSYDCQFSDNLTGEISETIQLTPEQLSFVMQFNLHPDGEPEGFEQMYQELEPIFKGLPNHLRPIP